MKPPYPFIMVWSHHNTQPSLTARAPAADRSRGSKGCVRVRCHGDYGAVRGAPVGYHTSATLVIAVRLNPFTTVVLFPPVPTLSRELSSRDTQLATSLRVCLRLTGVGGFCPASHACRALSEKSQTSASDWAAAGNSHGAGDARAAGPHLPGGLSVRGAESRVDALPAAHPGLAAIFRAHVQGEQPMFDLITLQVLVHMTRPSTAKTPKRALALTCTA